MERENREILRRRMIKMNGEIQSFNKRFRDPYRYILEEISILRILMAELIQKLQSVICKKSARECIDIYEAEYSSAIREIGGTISRIWQNIKKINTHKISGLNVHFSGEKEEHMPEIRQSIVDVIDIWGQKEGVDIVSYFKKKCLKSLVIADDIDDLKTAEESEKNKEYIRKLVQNNENSKGDAHQDYNKYPS